MPQHTDADIYALRHLGRRKLAKHFGISEWTARIAIDRETKRLATSGDADPPTRSPAEPGDARPARTGYEVRADGDIFINYDTRTIVTNLGEFGSFVFSFDRHAAMRRRYADEWEQNRETIPEIARDFDLQPAAFSRYKQIHGWTHASDPFTDEEWGDGLSVDDAVDQTLESHRRAFHKKLQKEKWAGIIADAERWRRFEETALGPVMDAIRTHAPSYRPPMVNLVPARRAFDVVLHAPDLHYGKDGWADEVGAGYNREQARQLLIEKTDRLLSGLAAYGQPARIITAVGNDWFHIDRDDKTTTSGTPQDLDGSPHAVLWEGSELAISQIDMLRQVAPVEVLYVAGNHDRLLGWGLLHSVYCWFHNQPGVTIRRSPAPRQYLASGQTLIGFTHGDGAKQNDLPMLMAAEARALWSGTKHRAMFTGHLHFERTIDRFGVVIYQLPSLSGADRWHARSGYVMSRRAMAAYIVDAEAGVVGTLMEPVF